MEHTNRFLTRFICFIAALLTLRVVVWFFEQRAHDKEYWLIFAHVVPFMLAIITGAVVLVLIKGWLFRKLGARHPE